jgi:hypothetical protein
VHGLGVDPLTLATDLLVSVVIGSEFFDDVFAKVSDVNFEGRIFRETPVLNASMADEYSVRGRMQAASAAVLRLAGPSSSY